MFDFKEAEERILKFWEDHYIFQKSMDQREGSEPFVVFEGPPFANGNPGIHHFIGRVFKDLFNRYQTMRGRFVLRKGGWDTHGLPVELGVEKELGFTTKKDIESYGIAAYNKKCRESVWKYKREWEEFTHRIGYWVDLEQAYVTYKNPYIETLWNIIAKFDERGLLYQAHRVGHFCTRCGTTLSSHEVAQGYKKVTENSVYLKFKAKKSNLKLPKDTYILAWTTTPWTLPGNVALAVGEDIRYVLAKKYDEHFILAKELAGSVLGEPFEVEDEFSGKELVGTSYEPLFAVKALKKPEAYKVYSADFVTTADGTGIVHTAVMYGEDDYKLGVAVGLPTVHTVDEQGNFIGVSKELNGRYVKDAETEKIILDSLDKRGLLFKQMPYEHDYPFCWRCWTPLLYYATDSWFVRMSELNAQLLQNNETINWVPAHLKEGRFGQWLREGKDWNFSRERYWGTPLPVWRSDDKKEMVVASSLDDLEAHRARKPNRYWIIRHGQAEQNVQGIIDGGNGKPYPLTPEGKKQIDQTTAELKQILEKKPAIIFSSPLHRAKETADIISNVLGGKVVLDERLREIQLGPSLDGKKVGDYFDAYPTYQERFTKTPPGGESLRDVKTRLWPFIRELEDRFEDEDIVVVGHEYPLWMFADIAAGWNMNQSIAEKERRAEGWNFIAPGGIEKVMVRNLPRDERGEVDVHRPYVDDIVLQKNGKMLHRVPEIVDVWFDSGAMPFAQWHWPFENKEQFEQQFPADFICEGIDQTRGWFYTLLSVSAALGMGAPYRSVLSYGHVLDEKGQKMSKSKGNIVKPADVIDAVGVDTARWYFYTINNPNDPKYFSMKEVRERLTGFMGTLQNCVKFWELYANAPTAKNFSHGDARPENLLDQWILSRLHRLIRETTERLNRYDPTGAARAIELFAVDDLSQWWLRRSRKRPESLGLLRHVLLELDKLLAPFIPFAAEDMHLRLHAGSSPNTESVHLHDWPTAQEEFINDELEQEMEMTRELISAGLAIRKQHQIKVRQPLSSVMTQTNIGVRFGSEAKGLIDLVKDELNVKEVKYAPGEVSLDLEISPALKREGWVREIMRTIQEMRKEAGLKVGQGAFCQWHTNDKELIDVLKKAADDIKKETTLEQFLQRPDGERNTRIVEREFELQPKTKLWLGLWL